MHIYYFAIKKTAMNIKKIATLCVFILLTARLCAQTPQLILDFPSPSFVSPHFAELNGITYFLAANNIFNGTELWRTDGTQSGTFSIKDLAPPGLGNIAMASNGKKLFFKGIAGPNFYSEPYVSNGGVGNIFKLKKINSSGSSEPDNFIAVGEKVFFRAVDGTSQRAIHDLWVTDGTSAGTTKVMNDVYARGDQIAYNGKLLFTHYGFNAGFNVDKVSIYITDGTAAGTTLLLENDMSSPTGASSLGTKYTLFDGKVYFTSTGNTVSVDELWVTDGTAAGTTKVIATNPNGPSNIGGFTEYQGKLYFQAQDATFVSQPWVTDGTAAGTVKLKNIFCSGFGFSVANDKLYFSATDNPNNDDHKLWVSDGTEQGTVLYTSPIPALFPTNFVSVNDKLYFLAKPALQPNYELYVADGNPANTKILIIDPNLEIGTMKKANEMLFIDGGNRLTNNVQMYVIDGGALKWTGIASNNWFNANNWAPKKVPVDASNVIIPADVPNNPLISSGSAFCKKLLVEIGASISMTGGKLNVFGEMKVADATSLNLSGGTIVLNHACKFPNTSIFNNLTLVALNNIESENTYEVEGFIGIQGNLIIKGTPDGDDPSLPFLKIKEGSDLYLTKDLTVLQGVVGMKLSSLPLADNSRIPSVHFTGNTQQLVRMLNNIDPGNANSVVSGFNCNVVIDNSNVRFIKLGRIIECYNLLLSSNFDLRGNYIRVDGKINYEFNFFNPYQIVNSKPKDGKLEILNVSIAAIDADIQYLNLARVRSFEFSSLGGNDTIILFNSLQADTVKIDGHLNLLGSDLRIGSPTTNIGYLDCRSLTTNVAQGTIYLQGNSSCPRYQMVAGNINNLVLNNPSGVELNNVEYLPNSHPYFGRMNIFGTASLVKGNFDIKKSAIFLVNDDDPLSKNVARIVETASNTFINSLDPSSPPIRDFYLVKDTTVLTGSSKINPGGLGFIITCSNPLNGLTVLRTPMIVNGLNGGTSISRVYTISNPGGGTNLNAGVSIRYDDTELQGVNEGDLSIFRRSDNEAPGVWHLVPSTVNNTDNVVTANAGLPQIDYSTSGPAGFTFYTLASASSPLRPALPVVSTPITNTTKVLVYPNPFTSNISARFDAATSEMATIQVLDMSGKSMHQEKVELIKGSNNVNISSMEKLTPGYYFLKITAKQTNRNIKILKQ